MVAARPPGRIAAPTEIWKAMHRASESGMSVAGPDLDQPAVASEPNLPNLDALKLLVREYYGDYIDTDGRHQCSFDSAWAHDVARVIASAKSYLDSRLGEPIDNPALVLDIDDTAVTTYPYLANTGFGARQNRELLPAIPATRDLVQYAHDQGVAIFFVTVRLEERRSDTLANLKAVGYPTPTGLFLRSTEPPFPTYLPSPDCSPATFKASIREHIKTEGYAVLASIGDQLSDLVGGHADKAFKLPNPMYHTR